MKRGGKYSKVTIMCATRGLHSRNVHAYGDRLGTPNGLLKRGLIIRLLPPHDNPKKQPAGIQSHVNGFAVTFAEVAGILMGTVTFRQTKLRFRRILLIVAQDR